MGNGFFKFKIPRISEAPKDEIRINFFAKVNGQPFIGDHFYFWLILKGFHNKFLAFFQGKHVFLVRIDANGDKEFVKKGDAPFDNIVMP